MASGPQQPGSLDPGRGRHTNPDHRNANIDGRAHELGRRKAMSRGGLEQSRLVNGVALDTRNFSASFTDGDNLVIVGSMRDNTQAASCVRRNRPSALQ